ncbi:helix-turn-helix domain-containing protein [Olivibacter jilunii]|uniref:helix-turn-helix domain-containing protein n=1 Tax=Olivibacter jilunii TaxID=985016 RepID=UPI0010308BFB|nr:helix-turn-helix domain-containing protein [Olivibacter jilunii]
MNVIRFNGYTLCSEGILQYHDGETSWSCQLMNDEALLLRVLYRNRNVYLSTKNVLLILWGQEDSLWEHNLEVYIKRLQAKFARHGQVTLIADDNFGIKLKIGSIRGYYAASILQ